MRTRRASFGLILLVCALSVHAQAPRIESVVPSPTQPHASDPATIFYDPFDRVDPKAWPYMEPAPDSPHAKLSTMPGIGGLGHAMECFYAKGSQGVGNRKLVFGDSPTGKPLRRGERFEDVYWRIYVKHQDGWEGNPDKMTRATSMTSPRWAQAFILHVWSSGVPLTLDPATGVRNGQVVTTRYNDFPNLKWLGNSPKGKFPTHSAEEAGRWVCVEARLKLNTPGQKDGYAALWVDGKLDAERKNMDFRGTYTQHTINAIFLEAYWNNGSPKDQTRWYDDFVVSTKPIGPVTAPANPTLIVRKAEGIQAWQAEVAGDAEGKDVVWTSNPQDAANPSLEVTKDAGVFSGSSQGKSELAAGQTCFTRVRHRLGSGEWTAWSDWHQPFTVGAKEPGAK